MVWHSLRVLNSTWATSPCAFLPFAQLERVITQLCGWVFFWSAGFSWLLRNPDLQALVRAHIHQRQKGLIIFDYFRMQLCLTFEYPR
ncbi:MAG: hypothetical protein AUK51_13425 [Comamonadaceae bacterium CG2_30_59_20]|nr:MAG: hypothetical protein AUK51_13425 [Comamonadaceae bacterium CG2_30_59_20]